MEKKSKSFQPICKEPSMLNAEQIAARRVPLVDAELILGKNGNWFCHYCSKRFMHEGPFMKHKCEPKRRALELMSPLGQAAFDYYRTWMKLKRHSQPGAPAFLESKYYRAFINFANLIIKANISKPDKYMEIMVAHEIQPVLWCRDQVYSLYTEWSDRLQDPIEQVQDSINYLLDICEKENIDLPKIVSHLGPQRILSLIRQRRLTPWLVFCSTQFCDMLRSLDTGELTAFNAVVNASYWGNNFKNKPEVVTNIKTITNSLGI